LNSAVSLASARAILFQGSAQSQVMSPSVGGVEASLRKCPLCGHKSVQRAVSHHKQGSFIKPMFYRYRDPPWLARIVKAERDELQSRINHGSWRHQGRGQFKHTGGQK
jgi:hypothetical protein